MCVLCDGMYIIERGRQEQDKVGDRNHQLVEAVSLVFSRSQDTVPDSLAGSLDDA